MTFYKCGYEPFTRTALRTVLEAPNIDCARAETGSGAPLWFDGDHFWVANAETYELAKKCLLGVDGFGEERCDAMYQDIIDEYEKTFDRDQEQTDSSVRAVFTQKVHRELEHELSKTRMRLEEVEAQSNERAVRLKLVERHLADQTGPQILAMMDACPWFRDNLMGAVDMWRARQKEKEKAEVLNSDAYHSDMLGGHFRDV